MVLDFLFIASSIRHGPSPGQLSRRTVKLSSFSTPVFQYLPSSEDEHNFESKFDMDTKPAGKQATLKQEYYFCSVEVKDAAFTSNFAFGQCYAQGYGGALFTSYSFLVIEGISTFSTNKASVGGGICTLATRAYLDSTAFTGNVAFTWAGAVYFQGAFAMVTMEKVCEFYHIKGTYTSNTAAHLGGAVAFSCAPFGYFQNVDFSINFAGINGGGVYALNTPLKLFECSFTQNEACKKEIRKLNSTTYLLYSEGTLKGRGGGAICFVSNEQNKNPSTKTKLYSHKCCWAGNSAVNGFSFGKGAGNEILFDGSCVWESITDFIKNYSVDSSVSHCDREYNTDGLIKTMFGLNLVSNPKCEPISHNLQSEKLVMFKSPLRVGDGAVSNLPSPSIYTYVASPITRLPYATTSSVIVKSKTISFKVPVTYTVASTYAATPFSSPFETPFSSPIKTLFPTLIETPFKSPFDSPFETPFSSPIKSPLETPFSSPIETPFESPLETPEDSPSESPYKTPDISPGISPVETIEKTASPSLGGTPHPSATFEQSPFSSPYRTPESSPIETLNPSPEETIAETPNESPEATIKESPLESPIPTLGPSPFETPIESTILPTHLPTTPVASAPPTPTETPFATPDKSPIESQVLDFIDTTVSAKQKTITLAASLGSIGFLILIIIICLLVYFSSKSSEDVENISENEKINEENNENDYSDDGRGYNPDVFQLQDPILSDNEFVLQNMSDQELAMQDLTNDELIMNDHPENTPIDTML